MPELPEVETIVRFLRPKIRGTRILSMRSDTPRLFRDHKSSDEVRRQIKGKKIITLERFGKNIIFKLNDGTCFSIHLMMTGRLLLNPKERGIHDRMEIKLSGGNTLIFNDIRKFGRCRIIESPEKLFGREPLEISFVDFKRLIFSKKMIVKSFFLNQTMLAGIGNIYSDEILWYAGADPRRRTNSFSPEDIKNLYHAMRRVLNLAIKKEGTSRRDYRKPDGSEGGYYEIRKVYDREGERCGRDGAIIKRTRVGGRSAHYCPRHQR